MPANHHGAAHASGQSNQYFWRDDSPKYGTARLNFEVSEALLAEVDFKWLMAGQGQRVDPNRFYIDQAYTLDLLQSGLRSVSPVVRACAASLLAKIQDASGGDPLHMHTLDVDADASGRSPAALPVLGRPKGRVVEGRPRTTAGERY